LTGTPRFYLHWWGVSHMQLNAQKMPKKQRCSFREMKGVRKVLRNAAMGDQFTWAFTSIIPVELEDKLDKLEQEPRRKQTIHYNQDSVQEAESRILVGLIFF
jgi:hypothetical protein